MEQVIFGGHYDLLNVADTEYNSLCGGSVWSASELNQYQIASTAGKIKNLRVELNDVPGTGTYVFTVRLNGAPTTLTCEVAADGTTASDTAHEVTITGGDRLALECNPDNPDDARYARWTVMFEGDNVKESLILGTAYFSLFTDTRYGSIFGAGIFFNTNESHVSQVIPTAGKIKNLYVWLSKDPGVAPDGFTFTLRVNGADGLDGANPLEVAIVAEATTGFDTTHEITVAAGDVVALKCLPVNSPLDSVDVSWGMTFVADTDGESLILSSSEDPLDTTDTEYNYIIGQNKSTIFDWTATESERYQLGQACTLKKLYVLLDGSPSAGDSYIFTLRVTDPEDTMKDGTLTVTIANAETTGNDVAHTDVLLDGQTVAMKCVPVSSPDARDVYWGLVGFRQPGWTGKISGVTNPAKVMGVAKANIQSVKGVV